MSKHTSDGRVQFTTSMASRLARARRDAGISQGKLAKTVWIPRAQVKRLERAEVSTVDEATLARLEKALGIALRIKTAEKVRKTRPPREPTPSPSVEADRRAREVERGTILKMLRTMLGTQVAKLVKRHGLGGVTLAEVLGQERKARR